MLNGAEEVRTEVGQHMTRLANRFTSTPLVVEIAQPDLIDMDLTDLPGLKDEKEKDAAEIRAIVELYLRDDNVMPVVLCKAEKSHETQFDVEALKQSGLKPSKALMVVNYLNKQIGDITAVSGLNEYCTGYQRKFDQVRFVMLHFKDGIDKENMNFHELSTYYRSLADQEDKAIQQYVEGMDKDAQLIPAVKESLGVRSAFQYMHDRLHGWMVENSAAVLRALKEFVECSCHACAVRRLFVMSASKLSCSSCVLKM